MNLAGTDGETQTWVFVQDWTGLIWLCSMLIENKRHGSILLQLKLYVLNSGEMEFNI